MSEAAEFVRAWLVLACVIAAVAVVLWLAWEVWPSWDLRRRESRLDREALARFPDQAAVMAALRPSAPCGCRADWATGPPSACGCPSHPWSGGLFGSGLSSEILMAWRARDVLRRKGLWK